MAGKTGTAQVSHVTPRGVDPDKVWYFNRAHAWFAGYAPARAPEIAIVVLIEHGGGGGEHAAPVAMRVVREWQKLKEKRLGRARAGSKSQSRIGHEERSRSDSAAPPVSTRRSLLVIMAIVTLGLVNLYSATSVFADDTQRVRLADIYTSQIYWIVVGTLLAILVASIDYRSFDRLAMVAYLGGLVALGLVFVLAHEHSRRVALDRHRQLQLPAERVHEDRAHPRDRSLAPQRSEDRTAHAVRSRRRPSCSRSLPVAAVMAQPDLGTSIIYILTAASMLAMSRIRWSALATLVGLVAVIIPTAWNYVLLPYQKDRITSFLNPEDDKTGSGWHALQSLTAIGNGQFLGEGFMQGTQNQFQFLPDQYSDFPFAVFCEDWGFVGRRRAARPLRVRVHLGDPRGVAREGSLRRRARHRRRREPLLARRLERRHGGRASCRSSA